MGDELRELVRALRRHRWKIAAIVAITVVAASLWQLVQTPLYRSVATVQVELTDEEGANRAEAESRNAIRVENEAKIYRSRSVAARVVEDLELMSNPTFMGGAYEADGDYSSDERIDAISRLTRMIHVSSTPQSDLLDIEVVSESPELASRIANQLPASAQSMRISRRQQTRTRMLTELDREAQRLSATLAQAEASVAAFRTENGMLQGAGSQEDLAQINRVAVEAASARGMSSAEAVRAAGVAEASGIQSFETAESALLQQQRRRLAELEGERTRQSSIYGAGHPQMISIDNEMTALRGSIATEESTVRARARADANAVAAQRRALAESEGAAAATRAAQLQGLLTEMTGRAFSNNTNMAELTRLERDAEIAREVYMSTVRRAEEVRSAIGLIGVNTSLISTAVSESEPFSPKPLRNIVGALLASLLISVVGALAIELSDKRLRSAHQIRRLFGLPTFGMFPLIYGLHNETLEENPVIREPHSLFAEVSRGAESKVRELATPGRGHIVLITSPLPGDGKSTVALSLCAAACGAGQRAIVVDFDLRRPGVMQEIQRQIGGPDLVTLLLESPDLIPLPAPQESDTRREVMTYKPAIISTREPVPNPAGVLVQKHVDRLLDRLRLDYDLIVINGPPALAVQDARSLSRMADHTLLVARWGSTTIAQVDATLEKMGRRVDAAVFDRVDYAEHARCGYEDEVQFYMESSPYYQGTMPHRFNILQRLKRFLRGSGKAESAA